MGERICSIAGCGEIAEAQGLCTKHFTAALTHGVFFGRRRSFNEQHTAQTTHQSCVIAQA